MPFNQHFQSPSLKERDLGRGRIQSFDLARGFTVLIMPSIHVVMLYSRPAVQQSWLGNILAFVAEGPGAQLFMLLMGVSFTFSRRINQKHVLQRAITLLILAYILNFLKFIVPLEFGILPDNLLNELHLEDEYSGFKFFLLLGDILHFAAIAYLVLYFVYRQKNYQYWSFLLAIAIMLLSPLIWDLKTGIPFVDQIIILFNGHPPYTFFPVFPWLVYPLMGLSMGYYLKRFDTSSVIRKAGITGVAIMVLSCLFPRTTQNQDWLPFYRTPSADTVFHLGFVLTWLTVFHWLSKKIPANIFFRLLTFCSKNITAIYLIQWVTICWCIVFTGYMQLNMIRSVCWMTGISTFTLLLTYAINRSNAQSKNI